jgi:YVTN family beta-propeller protein
LINDINLKFVLSGNLPTEDAFINYPKYIWFDGRVNKNYTPTQLSKIALISEDFFKIVSWKKDWMKDTVALNNVQKAVSQTHLLGKPIRFWATPDNETTWEFLIHNKVDFINTDKITLLADFLDHFNKNQKVLPYNRVIQSAGTVLRYGKPSLENHAMDVASLNNKKLVVVQERYGFFIVNIDENKIIDHFYFNDYPKYTNYMTVYSGLTTTVINGKEYILFSAVNDKKASLMIVEWNAGIKNINDIAIQNNQVSHNPLPNQILVSKEKNDFFLYTVLNGSNELIKIDFNQKNIVWRTNTGVAPFGLTIASNKIFVTNWAGKEVIDTTKTTAGVPWGLAYTDSLTGATNNGTVSVFNLFGKKINEINVGLHPNAILTNAALNTVYVSNGSSDEVSIIDAHKEKLIKTIDVNILGKKLQGSTPNALAISEDQHTLYVSNGIDNAIFVYDLNNKKRLGLIPTEAYPAGLIIKNNKLIVANLESEGSNVVDELKKARSIHNQLASVSIIPLPNSKLLATYTAKVIQQNLLNRLEQWSLKPRTDVKALPIPERVGEPSVFKHVVYIIKENKTYDQVFGDMSIGNGDSSLCVFGNYVTPNTHALAKQYGLMDNYYASGKSSAEGHQWTDAGMVSDYVEKNVRAWFRSYPHRQEDALVYNKAGFIWNHALTYGKSVKVYGEACETKYNNAFQWKDLYAQYLQNKKPNWYNTSTIDNLLPIIHPTYPDCDNINFSDQQRASLFIEDWKKLEEKDSLPNLMVLSLPNDHSAGTSPGFPTPNAMVADNDLALGKIVEMISQSKSWDSTVIFVTEDDSQGGWDHVSAYRTVGLVISPYSKASLVKTSYNQVSMLRTIEQILGLPPMNMVDATSRLMNDCFVHEKINKPYSVLQNNVPLDQMNPNLNALNGTAKKMALMSKNEVFDEVDGGQDDLMNRIIWYYAKGNQPYPVFRKTVIK